VEVDHGGGRSCRFWGGGQSAVRRGKRTATPFLFGASVLPVLRYHPGGNVHFVPSQVLVKLGARFLGLTRRSSMRGGLNRRNAVAIQSQKALGGPDSSCALRRAFAVVQWDARDLGFLSSVLLRGTGRAEPWPSLLWITVADVSFRTWVATATPMPGRLTLDAFARQSVRCTQRLLRPLAFCLALAVLLDHRPLSGTRLGTPPGCAREFPLSASASRASPSRLAASLGYFTTNNAKTELRHRLSIRFHDRRVLERVQRRSPLAVIRAGRRGKPFSGGVQRA